MNFGLRSRGCYHTFYLIAVHSDGRFYLYCAQAAIYHEMVVSDSDLLSPSHQLRSCLFGGSPRERLACNRL